MTYTISIGLVAFTCDKCGATFGVPQTYHDRWKGGTLEPRTIVHCVCCGMRWTCGDTENERLKKQLGSAIARQDQLAADRDAWKRREKERTRQLSATRGVVTRTKRRISHGVCPCCTRTFQNLREHMRNQHPSYQTEPAE